MAMAAEEQTRWGESEGGCLGEACGETRRVCMGDWGSAAVVCWGESTRMLVRGVARCVRCWGEADMCTCLGDW